jgi:hypothetical protein
MADFPTLRPATVSITPGVVPATLQVGYDGSSTTSTADTVPAGDALAMTFLGLTEAEARSVPDHQLSQQGRSFGFNSATLAPSETPPGFQWTYARPVEQDDIRAVPGTEFYALSVEFVGVWIRRASTPSASVRIRLRTTGARALPAGTPSASVNLTLTTTGAGMQVGTPSQSTLLLLKTTGANAITTPLNDPDYSSVILHLPLTNDSGFTDVSGRAASVTPGNVSISPMIGRWGAGSAYFSGATGAWMSAALADVIGESAYTIRFWFRKPAGASNDGLFQFYDNFDGSNFFVPSDALECLWGSNRVSVSGAGFTHNGPVNTPADDEWAFFQHTRAGGIVTTTINGAADPDPDTSSYGSSITQTLLAIGLQSGNFASRRWLGYIGDFQVSLVARPHVVPTGPLPIF